MATTQPKLRKDGQPKRSGRPPKDPTRAALKAAGKPVPPASLPKPLSIDDFEALIGLPNNDEAEEYVPDVVVDDNVFAGVTRTWLADVFAMDPTTVKKKLANCPTKGKRGGNPVYELRLAAQYLVPPRVDIAQFIKSMRPNDLPPILQSAYWDAQKKRQDWEINAGELWRTEKVIETLSETFKLIKTSVNLFADTVEQETGLSDRQREIITKLTDGLMDDIHNALVRQHELSQTPNQLAELRDIEEAVRVGPKIDDEQI